MRRWLANVLIGFGALLLALGMGTVGYAEFAEWQHAARAAPGPVEALPDRVGSLVRATPAERAAPAERGSAGSVGSDASAGGGAGAPNAALRPATPVPPRGDPAPAASTSAPASAASAPVDSPPAPTTVIAPTPMLPPPPAAPAEAAPPAVAPSDAEPAAADDPAARVALAPAPESTGGIVPTVPPVVERPTEPASYGPATWIAIPKLGVAIGVMRVGVRGGEYVVPSWEVGHHADSANPGERGNAVMNGHLETINAGRVFARLKDLRPGDAVYTYTATHRLTWAVRETATVPNTEHGFVQPTDDRRLTLYTCAGTFNARAQDYTHRLVVVAELAEVSDRPNE